MLCEPWQLKANMSGTSTMHDRIKGLDNYGGRWYAREWGIKDLGVVYSRSEWNTALFVAMIGLSTPYLTIQAHEILNFTVLETLLVVLISIVVYLWARYDQRLKRWWREWRQGPRHRYFSSGPGTPYQGGGCWLSPSGRRNTTSLLTL